MNKIVQICLTPGWGGLEMVVLDFHSWMRERNVPCKIICLKNSPLHKNCLNRGYAEDTIWVDEGPKQHKVTAEHLIDLDGNDVCFLMHRQKEAKALAFQKFQAKISSICHTFYDVKKKDLWHRYLFSKVSRWIVLTQCQKENLLRTCAIHEDKITIIPNGVDPKKFSSSHLRIQRSADTVHIGIIARLDPQKGQDLAIHALHQLSKNSTRSYYLHFFGDSTPQEEDIKPRLINLARSYGLEEHILFEGFHSDLENELPRMDLIWMPSKQETFGRCIIEAMACGIPVIASNAGGVPDIIQHRRNGMLFATGDTADLALQTEALLENHELGLSIRTQGLTDVRELYESEKIYGRLLNSITQSDYRFQSVRQNTPALDSRSENLNPGERIFS